MSELFAASGESLIRAALAHARSSEPSKSCRASLSWPCMPQILRKCGQSSFGTDLEIFESNGDAIPLPVIWRGIDGSRVHIRRTDSSASGLGAQMVTNAPVLTGLLPGSAARTPGSPVFGAVEAALRKAGLFLAASQEDGAIALQGAWQQLSAAISADETDNSVLNEALETARRLYSESLSAIASTIDTRGLKRPILVASALSHFANEVVSVPLASGEMPVTAIGPEGQGQQVQIVERSTDDGLLQRTALFVAANVPLNGYAVWDLGATLIPAEAEDEVTVSPTHLENEYVRVEFDPRSGVITSLFDKVSERELFEDACEIQRNGKRTINVDRCGNVLYKDLTTGDYGVEGRSGLLLELDDAVVVEHGPVRGAIRQERHLGTVRVTQTVQLTAGNGRIDFVTRITGQGDPSSITASFPHAVNCITASFQTPFGFIEQAVYATAAGKMAPHGGPGLPTYWVDLSEGDYGTALLNNKGALCCVDGNGLYIQLSGSATPEDTEWSHELKYSYLPHTGTLVDGEVVENASAISMPPRGLPITGNRQGRLPLEKSFVEVDSASIFIEAIWPFTATGEVGSGVLVRLYEACNTRGETLLTTSLPVKSAWLCDLAGNNLEEIPLEGGEAAIPFQPFEIITVKYVF